MVDADQVTTRSDTVSNVVLAEIYHYQHERVVDFRDLFKSLLGAKIQFYKEVCIYSVLAGNSWKKFVLDKRSHDFPAVYTMVADHCRLVKMSTEKHVLSGLKLWIEEEISQRNFHGLFSNFTEKKA